MPPKNPKIRAINQWTRVPCGSSALKNREGSARFFDEAIKYRYGSYAPWLKEIISKEDVKDKKLLEVGCGMGVDLLEFAKKGAICTGIDLTPKHVALAKKIFKMNNLPATIIRGDAENIGFPDNSFDFIYSHGVLHHTPDTEKALKEIHRVLRSGGKALIMVYHRHSFAFYGKVVMHHGILRGQLAKKGIDEILSETIEERSEKTKPLVKLYSIKEFSRMLIDAGFKISEVYARHIMNERRMSFVKKIIPNILISPLENRFGWYIVAEVFKCE